MFEEFIQKLKSSSFITLEITPPKSNSLQTQVKKIEEFGLDKVVDGFSVTDNPLAKLKYSPLFAALNIQERFKKPVLCTLSMRDRNKIALQSDLLGANDFNIRAILALTGDSAKMSDQPHAKGVFEGDSTLLLDMIKCLNINVDIAGRPINGQIKRIYPFAVTNSNSKNFNNIAKKIHKKIEHGAVGIITQPIFEIEIAKRLLDIFYEERSKFSDERAEAELIFGIFPITKFRVAQFLSTQVPGVFVPQEWIDRLYEASLKNEIEESNIGMELSKNIFNQIRELHPKVHIMSANRFDVAKKLIGLDIM